VLTITLHAENAELSNDKTVGKYGYHCAKDLKVLLYMLRL